jgi:hypothetical protein
MWGFVDNEPRVFVENKFWAGLTDIQPVTYLRRLATCSEPTVLLVIAPAAREQTLWRELIRRLDDVEIAVSEREAVAGVAVCGATQLGPMLALTSWTKVLSVLEHEVVDDPGARGDLMQLRALCDAADNDAFAPASREQLSDQQSPAFIIQLGTIVQATVNLAVTQNVLDITRLNPQASWVRIGRYARVGGNHGAGAWIGIHFGLWKTHGATPLWLVFNDTDFGRAPEVRRLIEPWVEDNHMLAVAVDDGGFAIALDIPAGEEMESAVRTLVDQLRAIARVLDTLPRKPVASVEGENDATPA